MGIELYEDVKNEKLKFPESFIFTGLNSSI